MTIKFALKDAGRKSLVRAISDILGREDIYNGIPPFTHAVGGYIVKCATRQKTMKGAMAVNIRFNMRSAGRRAFANAVGEILGLEVVYNGTPSFAYTIGGYTIDRAGILGFPDGLSNEEMRQVIMSLRERGYEPTAEEAPPPNNTPDPDAPDKLTVDMPLDSFTDKAIVNLREIVTSKHQLIRKALGADSLPIDITDGKLRFPWFTLTGADGEIDAYLRFVTALCEMAKKQQRVTAKERDSDNDKFAMRVFLIRLGFVGPVYKQARKLLLKNLTGNSSWKAGQPPAQDDGTHSTTDDIPAVEPEPSSDSTFTNGDL